MPESSGVHSRQQAQNVERYAKEEAAAAASAMLEEQDVQYTIGRLVLQKKIKPTERNKAS